MSLLLKSRDIFCVCGYEILENGKPSCCLYTRQAWEHPKNLMMLYWGKSQNYGQDQGLWEVSTEPVLWGVRAFHTVS